jgi:hypothetical protein
MFAPITSRTFRGSACAAPRDAGFASLVKLRQPRSPAQRLAFIDETWVRTEHGASAWLGPRGRLRVYAAYGRWKTLTLIAALRHGGIEAP